MAGAALAAGVVLLVCTSYSCTPFEGQDTAIIAPSDRIARPVPKQVRCESMATARACSSQSVSMLRFRVAPSGFDVAKATASAVILVCFSKRRASHRTVFPSKFMSPTNVVVIHFPSVLHETAAPASLSLVVRSFHRRHRLFSFFQITRLPDSLEVAISPFGPWTTALTRPPRWRARASGSIGAFVRWSSVFHWQGRGGGAHREDECAPDNEADRIVTRPPGRGIGSLLVQCCPECLRMRVEPVVETVITALELFGPRLMRLVRPRFMSWASVSAAAMVILWLSCMMGPLCFTSTEKVPCRSPAGSSSCVLSPKVNTADVLSQAPNVNSSPSIFLSATRCTRCPSFRS